MKHHHCTCFKPYIHSTIALFIEVVEVHPLLLQRKTQSSQSQRQFCVQKLRLILPREKMIHHVVMCHCKMDFSIYVTSTSTSPSLLVTLSTSFCILVPIPSAYIPLTLFSICLPITSMLQPLYTYSHSPLPYSSLP